MSPNLGPTLLANPVRITHNVGGKTFHFIVGCLAGVAPSFNISLNFETIFLGGHQDELFDALVTDEEAVGQVKLGEAAEVLDHRVGDVYVIIILSATNINDIWNA